MCLSVQFSFIQALLVVLFCSVLAGYAHYSLPARAAHGRGAIIGGSSSAQPTVHRHPHARTMLDSILIDGLLPDPDLFADMLGTLHATDERERHTERVNR